MGIGQGHTGVRVILVGRTGLDGALRLDPAIELVRVPSPLEAVAELASPLVEPGSDRSVVVVGEDAERTLRDPNGQNGRMTEFLKGLRVANPEVVVLNINKNPDAASEPFDGTISPELPGEDLRRQVRGDSTTNGIHISDIEPSRWAPRADATEVCRVDVGPDDEELTLNPEPAHASAPKSATRADSESMVTDAGDLDLTQALVKGKDILAAAIEKIRIRTGDDTVDFVPYTKDIASKAQPGDQPVLWEDALLGHLRGTTADRALLELQAKWLAAWLRLRDQQSQLRAAAFTDPLTGAYNRRYFDRFLASALEQARTARRSITVMIFDIDDFKRYNDRYGHDAGDEILKETVKLMRSTIRPTDRVCRIGGDEFAVIFYEPEGPRVEGSQHPQSVFSIAQRFQQQIQQHKFPKLADLAPGSLTISGGLATYPWDGTTVEQLLCRADQLALASKRQGKNAITFGPRI